MTDSTLWHWQEVLKAVGGDESTHGPDLTGISIDSRTLQQGDLFVPISNQLPPPYSGSGGGRDGHDFLADVIEHGGGAALVSKRIAANLPMISVQDTFQALWQLAEYARSRISKDSLVVAITGSSGKTTLRAWLEAVLSDQFQTHASVDSYNNHLGVPLSLARMPADSQRGVFEIGSNHPGEIGPLVKLVKPDIAVVVNVLPVHIGHFQSLQQLSEEKLSIADGLSADGLLILHEDLAAPAGVESIGFGFGNRAQVKINSIEHLPDQRCHLAIQVLGRRVAVDLPVTGRHWALTASACLAAVSQAGGDLDQAAETLSQISVPQGRGNSEIIAGVNVIDDSYNANLTSILQAISSLESQNDGRRIAILGEMLELGEQSVRSHQTTLNACQGFDRVITVGNQFRDCQTDIGQDHYQQAQAIDIERLAKWLRPGDTVLVKGSNAVFWNSGFVSRLKAVLA